MNSATSNAVISRFGSPLFAAALFAGGCVVAAVCADSVDAAFLIGSSAHVAASIMRDRRLVLGLTNRVGMVRREDDRPEAVGSRGGLSKAPFFCEGYTFARITRRREVSMRGGCARRSNNLHCSRR